MSLMAGWHNYNSPYSPQRHIDASKTEFFSSMDEPLIPIPIPTQRTMGKEKNEVGVTGGGKFVQIGAFLFICLGLALLYPINTIISATDWFMYIYPDTANISGILSNADFVASVVSAYMSYVFHIPYLL